MSGDFISPTKLVELPSWEGPGVNTVDLTD